MKKLSVLLATLMLVLFGLFGSANALPNSGTYMFTLDGNDSNTPASTIEEAINAWFASEEIAHDSVDLEFYAKIDSPKGEDTSPMVVTAESDNKSGEWFTESAIEFYTVKAGTEFAFYWVEGGATSGTWNTEQITNKKGISRAISHFSAYNTVSGTTPPVEPVPEPSTIVLLGAGLFGLGCIIRRKNNK